MQDPVFCFFRLTKRISIWGKFVSFYYSVAIFVCRINLWNKGTNLLWCFIFLFSPSFFYIIVVSYCFWTWSNFKHTFWVVFPFSNWKFISSLILEGFSTFWASLFFPFLSAASLFFFALQCKQLHFGIDLNGSLQISGFVTSFWSNHRNYQVLSIYIVLNYMYNFPFLLDCLLGEVNNFSVPWLIFHPLHLKRR